MTELNVDGVRIEVHKKRVKRINLHVTPERVWMSVPQRMPGREAEAFARAQLTWIRAQQAACAARRPRAEEAQLWGARVRLRYEQGRGAATLEDGVLTLRVQQDDEQARRAALEDYYRRALAARLPAACAHWEAVTGLRPCEYRLRAMRTRWGTCSLRAKRIWLNTHLAAYPPACLDYVLVHELAHLLVPSHSADFWAVVERFYPDWRAVRHMLRA